MSVRGKQSGYPALHEPFLFSVYRNRKGKPNSLNMLFIFILFLYKVVMTLHCFFQSRICRKLKKKCRT